MHREPKTKQQIIDAATKVFARDGYGGARIDQIAAAAGVNKAALYYHVGDKETLYAEVMNRVVDGMIEALQTGLTNSDPAERFRSAIAIIATRTTEDPYFAPLMLHEVAAGGSVLPPEIVRKLAQVFSTVGAILREGVKSGVFRKFDPVLTHMFAAGGLVFLSAGTPLRERIRAELEEEAPPAHSAADLAGTVSRLLLEGLLNDDPR